MTTVNGNCLCGAVEFTAELPSRWVAHCHCTMCQKISGSAFITWAGFIKSQCKIHDSHQQLRWYASSPEALRGFCRKCGSVLFFTSKRWPDEIHISLPSFQSPIDRKPEMHAFWDTHVDWIAFTDDLPRKSAQEVFDE
jgi:hypothetical protein